MHTKWFVVSAVLVALIFAELQIDFSIGALDTAIVGWIELATVGVLILGTVIFGVKRKRRNAIRFLLLLLAVLSGIFAGGRLITYQFEETKTYIEEVSSRIYAYREENGLLPNSLSEITGDSENLLDIGILNKRPLYYRQNRDSTDFTMLFPLRSFLWAHYVPGHGWSLDD